jgi:hypothetical protein
MEEVRRVPFLPFIYLFLNICWQNLRDGVAMDVDEEEEEGDSTQRLRKVLDYGIEVDFGILSTNEREVRTLAMLVSIPRCRFLMGRLRHRRRIPLVKYLVILTPR